MQLPVFGFCEGWLTLFSTKEAAEIYIEPIDVENDEWIVFDASGKRLKLRIINRRSKIPFFTKEAVEVLETTSTNPEEDIEEFKKMLISNIQALPDKEKGRFGFAGSGDSLSGTPLEQLSLMAQKMFQQD